MPEPQGPEPTGWELMRGLDSLREEIRAIGGKVVTQDTYQADRRALDARMKDMRDEIDGFHTKSAERDKAEASQRAESDRMRKTATLSIALAVAGPIITAIVGILLARGGAP
ncbi:hypothetical protein [Curtobacterium sp. VKM Ac-2884]|uniref:hypothetical protein n=1 Tax=Curtobacterium sp. VKM Ac-2884 TaxID=2783818 RepID=UPI00188C148B|nr:hypothetical protein [Curtobacterium sp. VKM Ac-2884]MBF4602846.1 hypothetical protein [Curtobacterium sp. VKM Ac-2884]